jgi:triacylglycerol esterase/lipase EstA (alpha/beta hydrolase family)
MRWNIPCAGAVFAALAASSPVDVAKKVYHNNFDCRSETNPNPVILLHGLGATYYEDVNVLETYLQGQGFCTFSITYGEYALFPLVGSLKPISESAAEIADFMWDVKSKTGAQKIDLVGHSEDAFQTLYVTKFGGVGDLVQKVFAIAPPTHGTTFLNLYNATDVSPQLTCSSIRSSTQSDAMLAPIFFRTARLSRN